MVSLTFAQDVPSYILDKIKQKAEREWPNDYLMQKHTIDTQVKKYIEVENYSDSRIPYDILDSIKEKSMRNWPDDYLMQKHTIDTQVKSYLELQ